MLGQHPKMLCVLVGAGFIALSLLVTGCGPGFRHGYRTENGNVVFYTGFPAVGTLVEGADADSFESLNDIYGKDDHHAFCRNQPIPNADPATFEYLGGGYAKDRRNGYAEGHLISTDGPHFEVVPNPEETVSNVTAQGIVYARDSHHVYRSRNIIDEADPATFVFVPMFNGHYLTHDRHRVWFHDMPLTDADGATFRRVSALHFADTKQAWGLSLGRDVRWIPMTGIDPATFTGIDEQHATDRRYVYYGPDTIKGANPETYKQTVAGK